jgi:hypothetical protein
LRYEESLVLTPQAGTFVRGGQALADGTVWGSSSRLLVEFLLERYELYAHRKQFLSLIFSIKYYTKKTYYLSLLKKLKNHCQAKKKVKKRVNKKTKRMKNMNKTNKLITTFYRIKTTRKK